MTQEEKDLLIRDLCCRLPYGVKAHIRYWSNWDNQYNEGVYTVKTVDPSMCYLYASSEQYSTEGTIGRDCDFEIRPYLFPISSITEEQEKDIFCNGKFFISYRNELGRFPMHNDDYDYVTIDDFLMIYKKLIENHFDVNGLIEKGLAIDATGLNIY